MAEPSNNWNRNFSIITCDGVSLRYNKLNYQRETTTTTQTPRGEYHRNERQPELPATQHLIEFSRWHVGWVGRSVGRSVCYSPVSIDLAYNNSTRLEDGVSSRGDNVGHSLAAKWNENLPLFFRIQLLLLRLLCSLFWAGSAVSCANILVNIQMLHNAQCTHTIQPKKQPSTIPPHVENVCAAWCQIWKQDPFVWYLD